MNSLVDKVLSQVKKRQSHGNQKKHTVGKYELGETLGTGASAVVKFAKNMLTGEEFAIKIIEKERLEIRREMKDQIKNEIQAMKSIRHPNVVQLYEVMASKSRIYLVMELVTEGELFYKIANSPRRRLDEDEARMYFKQLISAIDYCHSRGVYHRDIKPENLLLNSEGNIKISDFGLSALQNNVQDEDGLLHTRCGSRGYMAPEVFNGFRYRGDLADVWSCGATLYALLTGLTPVDATINRDRLAGMDRGHALPCPIYLTPEACSFLRRMITPSQQSRITISGILQDQWFIKPVPGVPTITSESVEVTSGAEGAATVNPVVLSNVFQLIPTSEGLNISNIFQAKQAPSMKRRITFKSKRPAKAVITIVNRALDQLGFNVTKSDFKMDLKHGTTGRKGHLKFTTEVFDVASSQLTLVAITKTDGDTLEFHQIYKDFAKGIKTIIWKYDKHINEIN